MAQWIRRPTSNRKIVGSIPSWSIIFNSLFIRTYCYCTTEANGKSWIIGIHGSYCFDCISETFGKIRPCGPMDKASDFESEGCGFDPHHGIVTAQLRMVIWTIGIHGSYCFDCISETFGNIYCIFTMTG